MHPYRLVPMAACLLTACVGTTEVTAPAPAAAPRGGSPAAALQTSPPAPASSAEGAPATAASEPQHVRLSVGPRRGPDGELTWQFELPDLPAISPSTTFVRAPVARAVLGAVPNLEVVDVTVPGASAARRTTILTVEDFVKATQGKPDERAAAVAALRLAVERRLEESNASYRRDGVRPMARCEVVDSLDASGPSCSGKPQRLDCGGVLFEVAKAGVRVVAMNAAPLALAAEPPLAGAKRETCTRAAAFDAASGVLALERVSRCAAGGDACDEPAVWQTLRFPPGLAPVKVPEPKAVGAACGEDSVESGGGVFLMGRAGGLSDERPPHEVKVAAFCMDRTEVTVSAYSACVKRGACTRAGADPFCSAGAPAAGDRPITCVTFAQARRYCEFVRKRLPTEEEWEYAARGAGGRLYPWGQDPPGEGVCFARAFNAGPCPVGASARDRTDGGILDLGGNVSEWTSSAYRADYESPEERGSRVVRGGSWLDKLAGEASGSRRNRAEASQQSDVTGFRCAR